MSQLGPLFRVSSVPIQLRFESKKAELRIQSPKPQLKIVRKVNGLKIKTEPARINISNSGLRRSILSMKPTLALMKEYAGKAVSAAREAVGNIVEQGNAMAAPNVKIADIAADRFIPVIETALSFIPDGGPEITVSEGQLDISYTPDELEFIWDIQRPSIEYVPYELKIHIVKYPEVIVEHIHERYNQLNRKSKKQGFEARV